MAISVGRVAAYVPACWAVPADTPFTIKLDNGLITDTGKGIPVGLSIYPSAEAADTLDTQDGIIIALTVNRQNALFVGSGVEAPETATYSIPGLPAGRYWVQDDTLAPSLNGYLFVES